MGKTKLVLLHEFTTTLKRRSFLIAAFGLPLIGFAIFQGINLINQRDPGALQNLVDSPQQITADGYVDPQGLIEASTDDITNGFLVPYPDETAALEAIEDGAIAGYYLIPEDIEETRTLVYVRPEFNPIAMEDQSFRMEFAVLANLVGGDIELAQRAWHPMIVQTRQLAPPEQQRDPHNMLAFWIPYVATMVFYIVILSSSSLLLNSIAQEKQYQVMEVLMASVTPQQMLTGKIYGLGLAGLTQTAAWVGTSYSLLLISGRNLDLPPNLIPDATIVVWGLVFFLLGFAIYGSLMAGLGALVPNLREATQATIVVIFPLIIPMFLMVVLIQQPFSVLSTVVSIFPLTAPVAMMTRLAGGGIPIWQPLLAAALMLATAWLVIRLVTRLFRAQTLLSGQKFNAKRFWLAMVRGQ